LVRHRRTVLAAVGAITLFAALGARRAKIDYGVEQFFLSWGAERETYDAFKRHFPREDTRVSAFWSDRRPAGLELYRDMGQAAAILQDAGLHDVQWFGNITVAESWEFEGESGIEVGPLVDDASMTDEDLRSALARHARDRLFDGFLWDSSQTVFVIHGYLDAAQNTDVVRRAIDTKLAKDLDSLAVGSAEIILTGLPIARARAPKLLEADLRLLLTGAFVVFFIILYNFFRHPGLVLLTLASVTPAYLCTVGLLGYLDRSISILTSFMPIVVLVVGMSDAIHLLVEFRDRRRRGAHSRDAVVHTFSNMAPQCLYTSLTTAIGFVCLAGTRIGIVVDFGVFTALAIILTFVFSMTVFPALLSFVTAVRLSEGGWGTPWVHRIVECAIRSAQRPSRRLLVASVVLLGVGLTLASGLRVNTFLIDDTKPSAPFMRDIAWVRERGFGFFQVNVYLRRSGGLPLYHPEALRWMEDLRTFAEAEPLVVHTAALTDVIDQVSRATGAAANDGIPETVEEAGQLLFLAEMQDPEVLAEFYLEAEQVAQVIMTVHDEGSIALQPFLDRLDTYLADHPFPAGNAVATGTTTMILAFTARLLESFGPSIAVAIVLITAIMIWMFRSVRLGLLALVPNMLPLIMLLAVMGAAGIALKPSTILVFSIAFGIAVDDTIHLLGRFIGHLRLGATTTTAIQGSLREAGPAVVMTTAVVTAGFLLLTASHFTVLALIGLLTAISALAAVSCDLFVFPMLVLLVGEHAPASAPVADQAQEAI
jgi:predicted RND superfamily exporter protein